MSVRILSDADTRQACLYDSVTGFAFGLVFADDTAEDLTAEQAAQAFVDWSAPTDVREHLPSTFEGLVATWLAQRELAKIRATESTTS